MVFTLLFSFSVQVFAASYGFTYKFKHQIAMKSKKTATRSSAIIKCTTTSNGGKDRYFSVEQYKHNALGTNTYITFSRIGCKLNQTDSATFKTTKGTSYTCEFWKPTAEHKGTVPLCFTKPLIPKKFNQKLCYLKYNETNVYSFHHLCMDLLFSYHFHHHECLFVSGNEDIQELISILFLSLF